MMEMESQLKNPAGEYRSVPFWSWNDELEPEELIWQIRQMKEKGIGGFFMHARGGLKTPYMGEKWMACVRACVEEAKKCGMDPWLYDEEGWPSGFAGGEVTKLGDRCHTRWMELCKCTPADIDWNLSILGIYSLDGHYLCGSGDEAVNAEKRKLIRGKVQETVYVVSEKSNPYYVDVLNPDVIRKFLEVTHEKYKKEFPSELGTIIPGFFTDEPQFSKLKIPYSYLLPEEFKKANGYELRDHLPALFLDLPGCGSYRYDFWKVVSRMFTEGFCKTIYDWCQENHCQLTGHLMREDSLLMQMQATAGVMPSYEYMHVPGIDWLRRRISSPLTPKQAGSAAAQLGRKFVLSEMFAMVGWDCSPEELKWIAEWQYVNGVNRMCQHLEAYSIRGIRKRDFPASQFYQQPWWEEYGDFNEYFARLGLLLTRGCVEVELLVLHPMHSGWMLYDGQEEGEIVSFGQKFEDLSQLLADYHIDHHYGDETLIARHGKVEGDRFYIGECGYRAVVIPDMRCMDQSTVELLVQFAQKKGRIYRMGEFPEYTSPKAREQLSYLRDYARPVGISELKKDMNGLADFPVSITENGEEIPNLHYQLRKTDTGRILYVVNLDTGMERNAQFRLSGNWQITEYVPLDDSKVPLDTDRVRADETAFSVRLAARESKVFFIRKPDAVWAAAVQTEDSAGNQTAHSRKSKDRDSSKTIILSNGGSWKIRHADLNAMTLDRCRYRIDGKEWRDEIYTIQLMDILLQEKRPVQAELLFSFRMDMAPEETREFYLAAEIADRLNARINGIEVALCERGWWRDKGFRTYDIRPYIRKGDNEIILKIDFRQPQNVYEVLFGENVLETEKNKLTLETEIESIYLLGDFGVKNRNGFSYSWRKELSCDPEFSIVKMPTSVYGDDFTSQGFCFFSGKMVISQDLILHEYDDSMGVKIQSLKGRRILYRFQKPNAAVAKLIINGKQVKKFLWQPYECDITDHLKFGENEIVWELYSSNRNLLGPHHHVDGELYAVWPADFTGEPSPFKADQRNVWSDDYHFVKFGL